MREHILKRITYATLSVALMVGLIAPEMELKAHAFPIGGQLQNRSITMNDSKPGTVGANYTVSIKPASAYTVKGIIIDFCSNDPIIGNATCTAPTGFSVGAPTVNVSPTFFTNTNLGGTWTAAALNSNRTLKLTNATGVALSTANTYSFTLTTATNPSTTGSFYARIITYTSDTGDIASYAPGTEGSTNAQDYGGIALSTVAIVNVTAKVMETLSFCVYNSSCGDDPSFTIGHAVGSATVLDSSIVDTKNASFSVSTNAQSGVSIRLKGDTLKSGTNSIAAAGASPATLNAGTANFGMRISSSGAGITAQLPYTGGTGSQYGLDTTTAGNNVTATWGDQIATSTGTLSSSVSVMTFAATASNVTPAGTYTAAEQLVSTGNY